MESHSIRALKKFRELDADGNGYLEGPELLKLAQWVWSSFHPAGSSPLSEKEMAAMRLDMTFFGGL